MDWKRKLIVSCLERNVLFLSVALPVSAMYYARAENEGVTPSPKTRPHFLRPVQCPQG